jgi:hypothetical protein
VTLRVVFLMLLLMGVVLLFGYPGVGSAPTDLGYARAIVDAQDRPTPANLERLAMHQTRMEVLVKRHMLWWRVIIGLDGIALVAVAWRMRRASAVRNGWPGS